MGKRNSFRSRLCFSFPSGEIRIALASRGPLTLSLRSLDRRTSRTELHMSYPLVYEINTRCWLRGLSAQLHQSITLADVPDAEFERWNRSGFTHIWLMGVWTTGPQSRAAALASDALRRT